MAYHHGDLRPALIEAARVLLDEGGLEAVTLRAVSGATGVSHNAPYRHFPSKSALLAAVAGSGIDDLTARITAAVAEVPGETAAERANRAPGEAPAHRPFTQRLMLAAHAYLDFAAAWPAGFRLLFETATATGGAFDLFVEIVAGGQESNEFVPGSPDDLAAFAWSAVHGFATLRAGGGLPAAASPERAVNGIVFGVALV